MLSPACDDEESSRARRVLLGLRSRCRGDSGGGLGGHSRIVRRKCMTIWYRPKMSGRSTSGTHRPGRHRVQQARSAVRCPTWGRGGHEYALEVEGLSLGSLTHLFYIYRYLMRFCLSSDNLRYMNIAHSIHRRHTTRGVRLRRYVKSKTD